ncbi:MAG: sulfotransferase [Planctomycetota bacterium]
MTPPKKRSSARRSGRSTRGSGRPAAADPAAVDAALTESAKLLRAGRPDRAETLLRRTVKEQGFEPRICANLANALLAQGNAESAHKLLRLSAEANPDVAHPWHDLGVLAKTRGALDEARTALRRAVELDPRHGAAWRNLGTLLTRTDPDDPDLAAMRGALEMLPRTGAPTAELLFAIGRALEQTERFDEAFDAYAEGNRLRRSMVRHSRAGYEAMADSAIARFDADWHARGPVPGASDAAPILVVGMPRSGSTLVEQILSSHPDAEGVGEVEDLSRLIHGRVPDDRPPADGIAALGDDELAAIGKRYARGLAERAPGAKRVVDKYLANAFHGGFVARALPNARIVHCTREPRDNDIACFAAYFTTPIGFVWDLGEIAHARAQFDRLLEHQRAVAPATVLHFPHEDLLDDQEAATRRLLEHCGLEWNPACLAFDRTERRVTSASAVQVREPLNRSSQGRWRRFAHRVEGW